MIYMYTCIICQAENIIIATAFQFRSSSHWVTEKDELRASKFVLCMLFPFISHTHICTIYNGVASLSLSLYISIVLVFIHIPQYSSLGIAPETPKPWHAWCGNLWIYPPSEVLAMVWELGVRGVFVWVNLSQSDNLVNPKDPNLSPNLLESFWEIKWDFSIRVSCRL